MSSGRNNARRRRVMLDEAVQQTAKKSQSLKAPTASTKVVDLKNSYSDAAKRRGQLKTTDLIPKRPLPIAIVLSVIVLSVVTINLLATYSQNWTAVSEDAIHALGFSGVGTVSAWFSSLLLLITGMASLQIYGMRKHRFDDYSGHYRIWLFLAVLFLIASANCVIDFKSIGASIASTFGLASENNFVVLLLAKLVALTALVIRGFLEIRASKAALVAVICVWVSYAFSIVAQIPAIKNELVRNDEFVLGNGILIGNVSLFIAVVLYARFVYLHANSMITLEAIAKKPKAKSKSEAAESKSASDSSKSIPNQPAAKSSKKSQDDQSDKTIAPETGATTTNGNQDQIFQMPHGEIQSKSNSNKKRARKSRKSQRRAA